MISKQKAGRRRNERSISFTFFFAFREEKKIGLFFSPLHCVFFVCDVVR